MPWTLLVSGLRFLGPWGSVERDAMSQSWSCVHNVDTPCASGTSHGLLASAWKLLSLSSARADLAAPASLLPIETLSMLSFPNLLLVAAITASSAQADVLIGRLTDSLGNPVPQVNIDVFDSATGDELALTGDFTASDGTFAVVVPAGSYDVVALPPAPPVTLLVGARVDDVVVAGTFNLGTLVLEAGVVLSGRALRPGGSPAVGADLEGRDLDTNRDVVLTTAKTDLNGAFTTTAPPGGFRLSIDPGVDLPLAAPVMLELTLGGATNLGNIALPTGYFVSVTALQAGGAPVVGADVDAVDSATGQELLTSSDDTNGSGVASFVVPAGVFDLEVCAPTSTRLVPQIVTNVAVSGPTNAGTVTLPIGRHLSGTVRSSAGVPIPNVDLDLFLPGTDTKVLTCSDDTNASGQYLTTVPFGTFDALFEDVQSDCAEAVLIPNVTIAGDLTLNVDLTAPGLGCRFCLPGIANSSGRAGIMDAMGSALVAQNNVTLFARDLPAQVFGFFLVSRTQGFVAQPGDNSGNLCLGGGIGRYSGPGQIGQSGSAGVISLQLDLAQTPTPLGFVSVAPGETWNYQAWFRNFTSTGTSNFTTGLSIEFQ